MKKCNQCGNPADLHIRWLAKKDVNENIPQQCHICNACMSLLWSKHHATQFGQTVQIEPA